MPIKEGVIQLFHRLKRFLWSLILHETEAHRFSIFSSHDFGIFYGAYLFK